MFNKLHKVSVCLRFALVLVVAAGIGFIQEIKAQQQAGGEKQMSAPTTRAEDKIEGLGATTTIDVKNLENAIAAYKAVGCAANEMNAQIRNLQVQGKIRNLLIYDSVFETTLSEYSILMNQLLSLERQYEEILPSESRNLSGQIKNVLDPSKVLADAALKTLKYFNTDTAIRRNDVFIARDEFIAKAVRGLDVEVYYPYKALPLIFSDESNLMNSIRRLTDYDIRATREIANDSDSDSKVKLEQLNSTFRKLLTQLNTLTETELPPPTDTITDEIYKSKYFAYPEFFDHVDDQWKFNKERWSRDRNYVRRRNTVDYLRAESAYDLLKGEESKDKNYWLDIDITLAGGNTRVDRNVMLDIFRGGNKVSFSGGAVVSYRIFRSDGRMLTSDTIMTYMPYKKSGRITDFVCQSTNTQYKGLVP